MNAFRLDPNAPLAGPTGPGLPGATLGDFWSWAYSDLLARDVRRALAQYVVTVSLDVQHVPRVDWTGPNLSYRTWSLRVHFAGHVDSWDVGAQATAGRREEERWGLDQEQVELDDEGAADCHVICHYPEKRPLRADPRDIAAWEFFVLSHHVFRRELSEEGKLDLKRLRFSCNPVRQPELRRRVHETLGIPG